jgi:hypothetical protein
MMDVVSALTRGVPEEMIGCPEGREIDFKRAPYLLDTPRGKWELAKDVAAYANAGGGLIVVGVRAERSEHQLAEVAAEICPVRKDLVDPNKYRDAILNGVTPQVDGIELRWFPEGANVDAILTIYVPGQAERSKPFVLRRMIDPGGQAVPAFAVPKRNEDRTDWVTAEHVQAQLALAALVASGSASTFPSPLAPSNLDDRAQLLIRELEATDEPCLALQLTSPTAMDLMPSLFGERGIIGELRGWKGIRSGGFDLESLSEPEPRGAGVLFGGGRWRARIGAEGTLDLVVPVRFDFLCWAMDRDTGEPRLRINPVSIVEVTYDFFRLANNIMLTRSPSRSWFAQVRAWRMKSGDVLMHSGRPRRNDWTWPRGASSDDYAPAANLIGGNPERDAFDSLVRIYALWGLGVDDIPFAQEGAVTPEAIVGVG